MTIYQPPVSPSSLLPITGQLNVKAYGAKGDGTTDDTAAIQAAIDAVAASGGGQVLLPPGTFVTGQLVLKNRVWLVGAGTRSTVIYLKTGTNASAIKNYVSSNAIEANAMFCGVLNLKIDGNKTNQTGTSHGIEFNVNPSSGTQATNDDDFDSHQTVQNVLIQNVKSDGYNASGRSLHYLSNVEALYCDGNGFVPAFDSSLVACNAGQSGLAGFRLAQPNIRLTNCNSYYSGNVSASSGHGFYIIGKQGPTTLTGCIAQDNRAHGFQLDTGARVTLTGCEADSNSTSSVGTYTAYNLWDMQGCAIEGCVSIERMATAGVSPQRNALQMRTSCSNNRISINHSASDSGNGTATIGVPILMTGSDSLANNDIRFNSQEGYQAVAYAATVTPLPYNGNRIGITLTGAITINAPATGTAHPGLRMTFILTQDATGGRVTTFGSGYKVSWTPTTTASKVNTITFQFDGTNWVQVGTAIGL
jgi:hypothetical protein